MLNKVLFHHHAKAILKQLHLATQSIDIAMCWFSNPMIFAVLMKKAEAGIPIRLILQYDQANFHPKGLKFFDLIKVGGLLLVFHKPGKLFHHKFCLVDDNKLITGSYNWTQTRNEDNLLLTEHPDLVYPYKNTFERLWQDATPLTSLAKVPPPAPGFQKLFEPILWDKYDLRHAILWGGRVWLSVIKEKDLNIWEDCLQQQRHFLKSKANYFEQNKGIWEETTFNEWTMTLPMAKKRLLKNYCQRAKANDVLVTLTEKGILLGAGLIGATPEPGSSEGYAFARYVQWFEFPDGRSPLEVVPTVLFTAYRGSGLQLINGLFESKAA